jgi:hypothetical protein
MAGHGQPPKVKVGERYGRLVIVRRAPNAKGARSRWHCRCDCGGRSISQGHSLTTGRTQSCGCLSREGVVARSTTHGRSSDPEYSVWARMIGRCENPSATQFARYGARGITVCARWRRSYPAFIADMGRRPSPEHEIDRIDNDRGYGPRNCRWATRREQANNRHNSLWLTVRDRRRTVADWARHVGLRYHTLRLRLRRGWPVAQALGLAPRIGGHYAERPR